MRAGPPAKQHSSDRWASGGRGKAGKGWGDKLTPGRWFGGGGPGEEIMDREPGGGRASTTGTDLDATCATTPCVCSMHRKRRSLR